MGQALHRLPGEDGAGIAAISHPIGLEARVKSPATTASELYYCGVHLFFN
jgi:hypothetical protein